MFDNNIYNNMKKIILALLLSSSCGHKTIEDDLDSVEVQDISGTVITDQEEGVI
jgi:hypothetical protein